MPSIASKCYKAGDVVIQCKPLVHCLETDSKGKHCDHCIERSDNLKKCAKCLIMSYCGKDCQQTDWKCHKHECKIFGKHKEVVRGMACLQRVILRFWLRVQNDPDFKNSKCKLSDGSEVTLSEMEVNNDLLNNEKYKNVVTDIVKNLNALSIEFNHRNLIKWLIISISGCTLFDLLGQNLSYRHVIAKNPCYGYGVKPIAKGIFAGLNKIGHSCVGNVDAAKDGLTMKLRATKEIKQGEPLTMILKPIDMSGASRLQLFRKSGFNCTCTRCRLDLDKDIDYDQFHRLAKKHSEHWLAVATPDARFINCEYRMDWLFFLYLKQIYSEYHPYVSEFMVLSLVCYRKYSRFETKSEFNVWYKEAEDRVRLTHGSDHSLMQILETSKTVDEFVHPFDFMFYLFANMRHNCYDFYDDYNDSDSYSDSDY